MSNLIKTTMNSPVKKTASSEILKGLLWHGDYQGFMVNLIQLPKNDRRWSYFHYIGVRVLIRQNKALDALRLARELAVDLPSEKLRYMAGLEALYLGWLFDGREQALLETLSNELLSLPTQNLSFEHRLYIREMGVRLMASKFMLGLVSGSKKPSLIRLYEELIDDYAKDGHEEEAFDCMNNLIRLLNSKPCGDANEALAKLRGFVRKEFIDRCPYKKAQVAAGIADMTLQKSLDSGSNRGLRNSLDQAVALLEVLPSKLPLYELLTKMGVAYLNYGEPKGRKLLNRVIRYFATSEEAEYMNKACASMLLWLRQTGNNAAINTYRQMLPESAKNACFSASPGTEQKSGLKDVAFGTSLSLMEADILLKEGKGTEAVVVLNSWRKELKVVGITVLTAQINARLACLALSSDLNLSQCHLKSAIHLFHRLGYKTEAINLIGDWLSSYAHLNGSTLDASLIEEALGHVNRILPKQLTVDAAMAFANVYEAAALAYLCIRESSKSLRLAKESQLVYEEFQLRPRLAFNQLYQGQIVRLLYQDRPEVRLIHEGQAALATAESLFRWMNFRPGLIQCHKDRLELEELALHTTPFQEDTAFIGPSSICIELSRSGSREQSMYQQFRGAVLSGQTYFNLKSITNHLNQN